MVAKPDDKNSSHELPIPWYPPQSDFVQLPTVTPVTPEAMRWQCHGLAINSDERYPDHNTWLNDWQELSARFRISPELPPIESALTRVIGWFVKRRRGRNRTENS